MKGITTETVGEGFKVDLLRAARDKTLELILEMSALIKPGMKESEAKALLLDLQTKKGAPKSWHPPQIRFGENSVLPFNKKGLENPTLNEDDIYFLDIGPIFDGHEGDVGRAFALGKNAEMHRCCQDVETIWRKVSDHWRKVKPTGEALYQFAEETAASMGWMLCLEKANGHRIADFPHAASARGSIQEFPGCPAQDRWILEIQIRHPKETFGAFYEDLL